MATSSTPVGRDETKKLTTLLQALYDNTDSEEFRNPVDVKGLGLNDYFDIIKNPMDLGTVKKNLKANKYKFVEDCLNDIQLIWDNCKQYNAEGSWIWKIADKLEKFTAKMIKNHLPNQPIPKSRRGLAEEKSRNDDKMEDSANEADEDDGVNQQSKLRLTQRVKNLSQEQLGNIVKIIQEESPSAWKEIEKDKFQIVVDNIKKDTFKKIEDYMNECLEEVNDQIIKKVKIDQK
mmetsp:Transcript_13452/g.15418  ORF Transcript_13452/g.15418 Transcript_13452/m.15418 type:complete len:233 (-) Transcript_13452:65-763(-)|eukprot:CAMPEP_0176450628 /NCGR_PEP_ID=MMETSP0127-20121128/27265_1 /TAXON_ID=938130 /ORGANISM="Platyophrya macrostoma, Strain WH" /LENGTH=232 /DNA_ID=CAMNT_0017838351 /DNA_START=15 /DNA_END=713 /DNA_ORIENTATION=-